LVDLAILFDGEYRENMQPYGVYDYIEKYVRTPKYAREGLYCYNFCLDTNIFLKQPNGAINLSRFNDVQFEFNTIIPPINLLAQSLNICDPVSKEIIGVNKPYWNIYQYNYNLFVFEERYNILTFMSGNCGTLWQY
jgi:hypothetical protein